MVHPFGFEQTKEAFRNSVVITVSLAAHTASNAMLGKDFLIIAGSVLTAPIRVVNQALCRSSTAKRHLQCINRQLAGHPG